MPRTFVFMLAALVISVGVYLLLDQTYQGKEHREFVSFLAGMVPTAAFYLIDKLTGREPAASPVMAGDAAGSVVGWGTVTLFMTVSYLALSGLANVFTWGLQDSMVRLGTANVSVAAHDVLSVTIAGALMWNSYLALVLVAVLIGFSGAVLRYWYFLVASLFVALLLFLPRIVRVDPSTLTFDELLRRVSGIDIGATTSGYGRLTVIAFQLAGLLAVAFGLPLLWYGAAKTGGWLRRVLHSRRVV